SRSTARCRPHATAGSNPERRRASESSPTGTQWPNSPVARCRAAQARPEHVDRRRRMHRTRHTEEQCPMSNRARRRFVGMAAAGATLAALPLRAALAETWPSRPVRILVGFSAGGGADAIARTIAERLGAQLGQSVVVENRPGASSTIAADVLATSAADGYTLMLADSSLLIASKAMSKVNFDPLNSFVPVSAVAIAPLTIAVNPDAGIGSLEDLARLSK